MPWVKLVPMRSLSNECVVRLYRGALAFNNALQRRLKELRFDCFDVFVDRKRRMIGFKRSPNGLYSLRARKQSGGRTQDRTRAFRLYSKELFADLQVGSADRFEMSPTFDGEGVDFYVTLPEVSK